MLGDTLNADDVLKQRLDPWLNKIPDYFDVSAAYERLGQLKAKDIRKKHQIEEIEDTIIAESDKPRSNETKRAKLSATNILRRELSEIQAELAEAEAAVKLLEYRKNMFTSSIYRMKIQFEL